jgi:hypothetical protein
VCALVCFEGELPKKHRDGDGERERDSARRESKE